VLYLLSIQIDLKRFSSIDLEDVQKQLYVEVNGVLKAVKFNGTIAAKV
jgi:hypothetical protein